MALTQPVPRPAHQRLTVTAAAVSVLLVLGAPLAVGQLFSFAPPDDDEERFTLTEHAKLVAELPGANVLQDRVILTLTPDMHAPVMSAEQRVDPDLTAGVFVPLGVSGLLQMNPYLAPRDAAVLATDLWPGDRVYSNLGPLVAGCLPLTTDPPGECSPTLLNQQPDGYYLFPRTWGSDHFLEPGTPMEAEVYEVLGGRVVAGGRPGTDTERVVVTMENASTVTAFTTTSASPGDTIWWAATQAVPVHATAYDRDGRMMETVDLDSWPDD